MVSRLLPPGPAWWPMETNVSSTVPSLNSERGSGLFGRLQEKKIDPKGGDVELLGSCSVSAFPMSKQVVCL